MAFASSCSLPEPAPEPEPDADEEECSSLGPADVLRLLMPPLVTDVVGALERR